MEDEPTEKRKKASCENLRNDFKECILTSDCVVKKKKHPKECSLGEDDGVPQLCNNLRTAFFECKRSLLDNRRRFRGRRDY
ncbi:cytochrome c oxidase assembly factor 5-like isoform X1 [Leptotrombidium deliense]|uniref:Cytochrome c oxidase assembly factor 5 n=1 Tax=Leptotrombidium deliense TaxID=299467 RepID=A0A443SGN2_9ACAR|nr:cytochrome c oxidase assembly factor 5-like isoform X1 [Leptotrombidium deliense]